MTRSTSTERLATLEQRLGDHETRCEERLSEIKSTVNSTLLAVEGLKSRAWGVVAALLAWALAQLWSENVQHFERLDREKPLAARTLVIGAIARDPLPHATPAGPKTDPHNTGDI
jgi:hypothetical protein